MKFAIRRERVVVVLTTPAEVWLLGRIGRL